MATPNEASHGLEAYRSFLTRSAFPRHPSQIDNAENGTESNERLAYEYGLALRRAWRSRRFFATRRGWSGLSPIATEPGHSIAILYGCGCSVILRPLREGEHYEVVGVSYVHCMMLDTRLGSPHMRDAIGAHDEAFYLH